MQIIDFSQYKLGKGGTQSAEVLAVLEVLKRMKNKQTEIILVLILIMFTKVPPFTFHGGIP